MNRKLLVLLLGGLVGCTKSSSAPKTTAPAAYEPSSSAPAQPKDEAKVAATKAKSETAPPALVPTYGPDGIPAIELKLVSAGHGPKIPLRLAPKLQSVRNFELTLIERSSTMSKGQELAKNESPPILLEMRWKVTDVQDDRFSVDFRFRQSVQPSPTASPALVEQINKRFMGREEIKGTMTFDLQGKRLGSSFSAGNEEDKARIANLVPPWPQEEIGQGASWTTRYTRETQGIMNTSESTYTVAKIDGDKISLTVHSITTGQPRTLDDPTLTQGMKVEMLEFKGDFSGEEEIVNGQFAPQRGHYFGQRDVKMRIQAPNGQDQVIVTRSSVESDVGVRKAR